jgi:hypothetical protein
MVEELYSLDVPSAKQWQGATTTAWADQAAASTIQLGDVPQWSICALDGSSLRGMNPLLGDWPMRHLFEKLRQRLSMDIVLQRAGGRGW